MKRVAAEAAASAEPDPPRSSLAGSLAVAKEVAVRLAKETDTLAAKLEAAERKFAGLGFGIAADVSLTNDEEERELRYVLLSYRKAGSWGLYIVHGREDYESQEEVPILNASKALRLRAAAAIGRLVEEMMQKARGQLAETERANRILDEALGALDGVPDADYASDDDIPF